MDRLIYTALSGMNDSMVRQRAIASNLANAQTTGFRAEMFESTPVAINGQGLPVRTMVTGGILAADMTPGTIVATGRDLDVALSGESLLAVQAADGGEAYTRRGDLSISPAGLLVNGEGRPVIGSGGPITLPLGSKLTISPDGSLLVADPASPESPPQPLDRIKLASWRGSPVVKGLDGLFRVNGGGVLPADEAARLHSGSLEQSNVDPTRVLVEMVEAQRLFDMRTKLVSTARELDEGSAGLMRLNT
jgi:flagellar basal-body rod protein FlgF